jgi:hypothetical protein
MKLIGKIRDQHLDLRVQERRRKEVEKRTRHLCEDISKDFPSICRGFRELGLVMPAYAQPITTQPVATTRSAEASIPCKTETDAGAAEIEQTPTCMRLKGELKAAVDPFHHPALESALRKFCRKVISLDECQQIIRLQLSATRAAANFLAGNHDHEDDGTNSPSLITLAQLLRLLQPNGQREMSDEGTELFSDAFVTSVHSDQIGRRAVSQPQLNIRRAVREARATQRKAGLAAAASRSRDDTPSFDDARTGAAVIRGYLQKRTSRKYACDAWQIRWFVVAGSYLMQFDDKDAAERGGRPSKRFELRNLRRVSSSNGRDGAPSIQIVWAQDLTTELRIVGGPNSAKAAAWLRAFRSCGRRPSRREKFVLTDSPLPLGERKRLA